MLDAATHDEGKELITRGNQALNRRTSRLPGHVAFEKGSGLAAAMQMDSASNLLQPLYLHLIDCPVGGHGADGEDSGGGFPVG